MYVYTLEENFVIETPNIRNIEKPFVQIVDGTMTILKGYAWDGCTPKRSLFGLKIIGTSDGHIYYKTGKPLCYYPSLVHDAMYQYEIGARNVADRKFYEMLKEVKFFPARIYYWAVRLFGRRWK